MSARAAAVSAAGRKCSGRAVAQRRRGGGQGKPGPRREGAAGSQGAAVGRDPHPSRRAVPLLTRWEAAGSARAVPAAGLRDQEAPPHRGREGRVGWGLPTPTSVLPRLHLLILRQRKLVRNLGRGGTGGRAGWLTAAQKPAGSAGARFSATAAAAAAAAAMAKTAGVRPRQGKRSSALTAAGLLAEPLAQPL